MIAIIVIVLQIVFFIVLLSVFILLCVWMWSTLNKNVPFIPVPRSILDTINKALDVKEGSVVYDLGCGDARILLHAVKKQPNALYRGLDNNTFALLIARLNVYLFSKKEKTKTDIKIIKANIFDYDFSEATHIFVYLSPKVLDDLLPIFEKKLSPGTRLVSVAYTFTLRRPKMEIDLERNKYKLARKIYIYDF